MSYTVKCAIEITDPLVIFLMKYFHGHSRPSPDRLFNASCFFLSMSGGIFVLSSLFNTIRKTVFPNAIIIRYFHVS